MKYNFPKLPFVLSLLSFALALALFSFLYLEIKTNDAKATDAWQKWETEAKRRSDLKFVEDSLVKTEAKRLELDSHFAQSSDVVPFLDMIEETGGRVGAKTQVTGVDLPKDAVGLIVRADSSGSFESIYKFLKLLENSPYELEFRLLSFNQSDGEGFRWKASFEIKLLSFIK